MGARRQLLLGFGILMLVTFVTGCVAVLSLKSIVRANQRAMHRLTDGIVEVKRLQVSAEQAVASSRGYLLTGEPAAWARFAHVKQELFIQLGDLPGHLHSASPSMLRETEHAVRAYLRSAEEAMLERTGAERIEQVLPYFEGVMQPARERLEVAVESLVRYAREELQRSIAESEHASTRAGLWVFATTLTGLLLSTVLASVVLKKLTEHLHREKEATRTAIQAAEAREEILAIVSHDLRNPLNAIMLGTSLMGRMGFLDHEKARKPLDAITSAAQRMKNLIEDVLTAAQLDAGAMRPVPMPQQVSDVFCELMKLFEQRASASDIQLSEESDPELWVLADRERLFQVFSNLIGNAMQFTPQGGTIHVSAEAMADHVRFCVADSGPGIPPHEIPLVFERNWQSESTHKKGTLGLGLYIARTLVELQGGRIWVESEVGSGTNFYFTLPRAEATAAQRSVGNQSGSATQSV